MGKGKKRAVKEKYSRKENMMGFLFILPAMIPLLVFWIIPIIWSGGLSFTDWDMMSENIHFMGLKNYTSLLKDPNFGKVLWNTLVFALGSTVPSIVIGLLVALAMNGARRGTGIYRTVIFAEKGVVEYLDDYIAADPDFDKDDIIDAFLDYCRDDEGHVYSLPAWGTTQVVYYRKDMFEEVGLDPDEVFATWQNVADAARKLQEHYSDVDDFFGFEPMSGIDCLMDMAYSNGASIVSEDEKTVTFNSDKFVEALETARQWINEEKIMGIHFGGDGWEYWYKTIDDVMQGRAGGYVGSSGDQGDLDFDIIAAHVQPGFNDHEPNPYVDPIAMAIVKKAPEEEKQAAFKWLTYLNKVGTKEFSIKTGYVPVRSSVKEDEEYKAYLEENPQALIPIEQAEIGRKKWVDPTGKVEQALSDACDLIEIENVPAKEALDEAAEIAQQALDEYWAAQ